MALILPESARELWCSDCEVKWATNGGSLLHCWVCERPGRIDTDYLFRNVVPSFLLSQSAPRMIAAQGVELQA